MNPDELPARRLHDRYGSDDFTTSEASKDDAIVTSRSKVGDYLKELEGAGYVAVIEPSRGPKPTIWRMVSSPTESGAHWLPDPRELGVCP